MLLFPCFPCLAFQNCFWAEYLFMGHTLKRQSAENTLLSGSAKFHAKGKMSWNHIFTGPPEASRYPLRTFYQTNTASKHSLKRCAFTIQLNSYTPLNFLGGLLRSPASGCTTHLSSTSLKRRANNIYQNKKNIRIILKCIIIVDTFR